MNCKMNGAVATMPEVEHIYVQPASSDNGVALGAAMLCSIEYDDAPLSRMEHCYLGPEYSNDEIESALDESKVSYSIQLPCRVDIPIAGISQLFLPQPAKQSRGGS